MLHSVASPSGGNGGLDKIKSQFWFPAHVLVGSKNPHLTIFSTLAKERPTAPCQNKVPEESLERCSNHSADAAVFGLGTAGRRRRCRRLAVVVRCMLGVRGVRRVGRVRPVAVRAVRVAVR